MGSPGFAVLALEAFAHAHEVAAVYTRAPSQSGRGLATAKTPVHAAAESLGIPVFTPASFRRDPAAVRELRALAPDMIIVFAYALMLPREVLDIAPCVCVHPSLLPRWRGANPIMRAMMAGDKITGVCLMQMVEEMDAGAVYMRSEIEIGGRTRGELEEEIGALAAEMLVDLLRAELPRPAPQEGGPTFANKLSPEETEIDWSASPEEIAAKIMALSPAPGAWFKDKKGERIKVLRSAVGDAGVSGAIHFKGVELLTLQREGRKPQNAAEFARGYKLEF